MDQKIKVEGTITKSIKLWFFKINTKVVRTSPWDGATFPYYLKIRYNVNNICYEKNKIVYWKNENINVGDQVIVVYDENCPSRILRLSKKN